VAQLLIWGKAREIVSGDLLAGPSTEEVQTLAALEAALDGKSPALVLADPARLEAEREATEAWLRGGGTAKIVLVAVADATDGDAVLRRFPFVDDLLARPVTPACLRLKLERALETIHSRRVIRQLESALEQQGAELSRKSEELSELNKIGIALSAERDIDKLLQQILSKSREITGADAGSLYLVERENGAEPRLRFKLTQNDSVPVPFSLSEGTLPFNKDSIAGYVAVTGDVVKEADVYCLPEGTPYRISRSFDERSGYRGKSMLVVPMRDHENVVVGVVQLINKKRDPATVLKPVAVVEEEVIPFTTVDEELAGSLASQAAVAFENADLIERIRRLFDEFIHAAVAAVEQRDPPTSGHSRRVAVLTVELARKVSDISSGPLAGVSLNSDQLKELKYAALLHDFGKVAVQEKYLRKERKLYASQMIAIRQRFAYIIKALEARYLRARLELLSSGRATTGSLADLEADYHRQRAEAESMRDAVVQADEPKVVAEASLSTFATLPTRHFADNKDEERFPVEGWEEPPFLSSAEAEALSIRKGSLTTEERQKINEHVQQTYEFLKKIPWTSEFRNIPEIAWAHHEKLDGSGYPRGRTAPEIPVQSKMMTIADIYDALVAQDRPYKRSQPPERALGILTDEASRGWLDRELLRVFIEAKIYDLPEFKSLIRQRT
jgi:HD-GYP domain-containing protein (c-di-GMP phosphodiesterase class II)